MINLHQLNLDIYKIESCILAINNILAKLQYYTHYSNTKMFNEYKYLYNLRWQFYLKLMRLDGRRYRELVLNNLPLYRSDVVMLM